MIIVVDSNIIFSALLSPEGTISDLLLNSNESFDFYSPDFMLEELDNHQEKILKYSGLSVKELNFLKRLTFKNINLIDPENINKNNWKRANKLIKDVDEFDEPFIALTLELNASLWTGDKKLIKGFELGTCLIIFNYLNINSLYS